MQFDPAKGFGEVHGLTGVRYEQSGHLFASNGAEVRIITKDGEETVETVGEPLAGPIVFKADSISTGERGNGLKDRHWREIKALVEANGGAWTNKEAGILYLEGKA